MLRNIIVRLVIYYTAWLVFLWGIFRLFPSILYHVARERDRFLTGNRHYFGTDASDARENLQHGIGRLGNEDGVGQLGDPEIVIPVVLALILAFGVTLPITWVYRWTHPPKKHNQSFVHALLLTPIGIALVAFLVKGSLALAFGLAGIVAAVRFRATIKEPMDAVYMLMVIGIGLGTGVQLTVVAYLASLIFVAIKLAVWKSNCGAEPVVLSGWRIALPEELDSDADAGDRGKSAKKRPDAT